MSGGKTLDSIEIALRNIKTQEIFTVYITINDNSLSRKWLIALNDLLKANYHLEKNYCFLGFADNDRNGRYILDQVNRSISAINDSNLDYHIDDHFDIEKVLRSGPVGDDLPGLTIDQSRFNRLHRYFEDLQGTSSRVSQYYLRADPAIRWHIRQLNLLCHEFESWALSFRKKIQAPQWQRPSQLMCWLQAPRFVIEDADYALFGIETVMRPMGGVFVGVNKAVGKHHWEVFQDEGRDSRISELTTGALCGQTEAAGDFDIEWANSTRGYQWQSDRLHEFRQWLIINGVDPEDPSLTIGHPQIGQVDLARSFGTTDYRLIWKKLNDFSDVWSVRTGDQFAVYDYHWTDPNVTEQQIEILSKGVST